MSLKRKVKRFLKRTIGDFTGVQWRDLDHKKVYAALAGVVAVFVLIIVLIICALTGDHKGKEQKNEKNPAVSEEVQTDAAEEDPLEVDAYDGINEVVMKYFQGLSEGDLALVEEAVDVLSEEEKLTIEKKKDYIEEYRDVVCYTKKGLDEDSFVVFASYEMKIYNIETPAPGIMALYVCTAEDGSHYIFNGEAPEELESYVLELAAQEEVAAVIAEIDEKYQQLLAEDEDLGKFAQTMLESQETAQEEAPAANDGKELTDPVLTTVNDGIRIREGRSTDARMLATIVSGTEVKVYANFEDGWSKIEYSSTVGYCKTEFLTSTDGVPMVSGEEASTEEAAPEEESQEENTQEASSTAVNKQMQLKEAVRIRAERSTDSERIANGYTSELVKVLENYSDGWSKIEYNGKVGYCKTEFLEEAR